MAHSPTVIHEPEAHVAAPRAKSVYGMLAAATAAAVVAGLVTGRGVEQEPGCGRRAPRRSPANIASDHGCVVGDQRPEGQHDLQGQGQGGRRARADLLRCRASASRRPGQLKSD